MIDTDKYTGHTPAPWKADYDFPRHKQIQTGLVGPNGKELGFGYSEKGQIANAQLIADAPLLLEEVKRLRALFEETNHHLDLMVERFGIEALVEMVGEVIE
jgi:hypothetical protein